VNENVNCIGIEITIEKIFLLLKRVYNAEAALQQNPYFYIWNGKYPSIYDTIL
jgi:hypothetical protein